MAIAAPINVALETTRLGSNFTTYYLPLNERSVPVVYGTGLADCPVLGAPATQFTCGFRHRCTTKVMSAIKVRPRTTAHGAAR